MIMDNLQVQYALFSKKKIIVDNETILSYTCFGKYAERNHDQSVADAYRYHKDVDPLRARKYYNNPIEDAVFSISTDFIIKVHTST